MSADVVADVLPDYTRWLHYVANAFRPPWDVEHDDLVQEGYIAMWRALETHDPEKGALASWLTGAARMRMRTVAHGRGQWFGHEANRGRTDVEPISLDAVLDDEPDLPVIAADLLEGIELAYHEGEIAEALSSLPEAQRRYVVSRFWYGLDPTSRVPGVMALVDKVGGLRGDGLWGRAVGARVALAESLAHLSDE